jgi:hypothetical protein
MADESKVKVVGQSVNGNTGTVTVQVPIDQLRQPVESTVGSWSNHQLGERYGLRPDSQALSIPTTRKQQIALARELYLTEPIVANVVDLMVDFCMTGFENRCEDSKSKDYFDGICKYGDFDGLHRQAFKEYLISSDVFFLRGRKRTIKEMGGKSVVAFDYTVLNPLFIEIEGPLLFDSQRIGIRPSSEIATLVKSKDTSQDILRKIPLGLRKAVLNGGLYIPDQSTISRVSRKRSPYERYATPFLARV